jgi:hypothetical protein
LIDVDPNSPIGQLFPPLAGVSAPLEEVVSIVAFRAIHGGEIPVTRLPFEFLAVSGVCDRLVDAV